MRRSIVRAINICLYAVARDDVDRGLLLLHLIAVFALAVAVLYGFIGVYVVPKLARLADRDSGLIRAAQYGAAAFFVGCAMTHIALAEHVLAVPELVRGHEWAHLLPHVAAGSAAGLAHARGMTRTRAGCRKAPSSCRPR